MARYIDIKYLGQCETCRHHRSGKCDTWCECGECYRPDVSKIPIADVVDVVSCKDCKHFCEYSNEYKSNVEGADGDCFIRCLYSDNEQFIGVKCDDFCSYGERRTDDGNL